MLIRIMNTDRIPLRRLPDGTWQVRKRFGTGKRVELALGTKDRAIAEERARRLIGAQVSGVMASTWAEQVNAGLQPKGWISRIYGPMKARCSRKGWEPPALDLLEFVARRSGGYCEVSGIRFRMDAPGLHPFRPSFDRIDSARGYEADNVRLVCLAVNFCMSHWGESVFKEIAAATISKRLSEEASGWTYSAQTGENLRKGGRPRNR